MRITICAVIGLTMLTNHAIVFTIRGEGWRWTGELLPCGAGKLIYGLSRGDGVGREGSTGARVAGGGYGAEPRPVNPR